MLPSQPSTNHVSKSSEPPAEVPPGEVPPAGEPERDDTTPPATGASVMRRARSWPDLTAKPPPPPPPDRPPLAPLILQIDYTPPPEEAGLSRWRRRYSERLTRRRRPVVQQDPTAATTAPPTRSPVAVARTEPSRAEVDSPVKSPVISVGHAQANNATDARVLSSEPCVAVTSISSRSTTSSTSSITTTTPSRPPGAVPKRLTHGRSQSATVPASVTAAAVASAVASYAATGPAAARVPTSPSGARRLERAVTTSSRPPTRPAEEALPSPSEHQQLGFIPRSLPYRGQHGEHYPSFVESGGGHSLVYGLDGYFPKPRDGQSLAEFLGSHEFKRNVAELDRENAHFRISESLIAAFEMVGSEMRMLSKGGAERRRQDPALSIGDLRRRLVARQPDREPLASDSPPASGSPSSCSGLSDLEVPDDRRSSISLEDSSGTSPSLPTPGRRSAPVSIPRSHPSPPDPVPRAPAPRSAAAENIGLSLLRRFPERRLPKASDLVWLVGEDQVPQSLLPMPCLEVSRAEPDEKSCPGGAVGKGAPGVTLRGTAEWAPPRAQIIFSLHRQGKRSVAMARQSHRCAGCGLKVSPALAKKFRWCEYLGRYFCTGCHGNQQFYIPARIIHKHDYNMYPVSLFSHQLLLSIWRDPLFHVNAINPSVLNQADLHQCRVLRRRLSSAQKYVGTCRFAKQLLRTHPLPDQYIMDEIDLYSLRDLVEANNRALTNDLQKKYSAYLEHCRLCQLCCGRAFHCEACHHQQVLFPFEVPEVRQCAGCGACYHYLCYPETAGCARCRRLELRRRAAGQNV